MKISEPTSPLLQSLPKITRCKRRKTGRAVGFDALLLALAGPTQLTKKKVQFIRFPLSLRASSSHMLCRRSLWLPKKSYTSHFIYHEYLTELKPRKETPPPKGQITLIPFLSKMRSSSESERPASESVKPTSMATYMFTGSFTLKPLSFMAMGH